jgi:type II secretory pathway pseudopilin PulG
MELFVVCVLIGILASIGIPQYLRTVETGNAQSATAILRSIGTANRMFALDHNGAYANTGILTNSCNSGTCDGSFGPCQLVRCKYLAGHEWDNGKWTFRTANPADATACTPGVPGSGQYVSCANRNGGSMPYSAWAYGMNVNGIVVAGATTPAAP